MNKFELVGLLSTHGIKPNKKLGQNFLCDSNSLLYIASTITIPFQDTLIEIGPGPGNLTNYLIDKTRRFIGIEYDHRFAQYLQHHYRCIPHVNIIQGDAARIDFETLHLNRPYHCVGNLPYAVAAIIVARLCQQINKPLSLVILIQKEMAERLIAQPGYKIYGSLSIQAQSLYDIKPMRKLSTSVFWPAPHVDSTLIKMQLKSKILEQNEQLLLHQLCRFAFTFRRKKLISVLKGKFDEILLENIWEKIHLNHGLRADHLSVHEYIKLTRCLLEKSANPFID
jgi:16S rRNA (adenine1518-N6/adenine1519-N6)-dimethyltransferase